MAPKIVEKVSASDWICLVAILVIVVSVGDLHSPSPEYNKTSAKMEECIRMACHDNQEIVVPALQQRPNRKVIRQ
jgi:hypothetical protein